MVTHSNECISLEGVKIQNFILYVKCVSCSVVSDSFATPQTVAYQAPLFQGIVQARALEWVAILFSRGPSKLRD